MLRVAIDAEPSHLNPVLDPDLWGYRIAHDLLCEPLFRRKGGSDGASSGGSPTSIASLGREFEPVLAERFRIDSDGYGVEIWLRAARFHDGRPLSAGDVRATLDMLRAAASSAPRTQALVADIARVAVEGPLHLRIDWRHTPHHTARRMMAALAEIDILPAAHFPGGRMIHQPFNRRPVCTGPYRLADWRRGSQIILRRSPSYWGPQPAYEDLRFRIATDGAIGLSWLRQGEVDVLGRVPPRYLADQVEPAVQRGRFQRLDIDANQVVVLLPNGRQPPLSMALFRQALSQVVDRERERLLRDVRRGLGTPQRSPIASGPGSDDERDGDSLLPRKFLTSIGQAVSAGSPEALLDAAGIVRAPTPASSPAAPTAPSAGPAGANRLRLYQGRPVRLHLMVPAGSGELTDTARRLSDAISKLGLKLESEVVPMPDFLARLRRGAFDLALLAWAWTGDPGGLDVEPLLSYALPPGHPALAELPPLLASARAGTASDPARVAGRLSSLWQSEAPLFLLYRTRQVMLLSPQLSPIATPLVSDFPSLRALRRRASY